MESILLSDQAGGAGTSSTARTLTGLAQWITTNTVDTESGVLTEDMLKSAVLQAYNSGGEPSVLLVSPSNKQVVSTFPGIAEQRFMAPGNKPSTIIGTADIYMSDFGTMSVVPDRFLSDGISYVLDPAMASVAYLRPFKKTKLAKTGDSEKYMMNVEYTLVVKNEAAHAMINDIGA